MISRTHLLAAAAVATALAGCVPASVEGPGQRDPAPALVAEVFDRACVKTLPDFGAAPAALAALGFAPGQTGTYYNGRDDISVKLIPGSPAECSVVWGVRNAPAQQLEAYAAALRAREPLDLSTARLGTPRTIGGVTYFNTRTSAK